MLQTKALKGAAQYSHGIHKAFRSGHICVLEEADKYPSTLVKGMQNASAN